VAIAVAPPGYIGNSDLPFSFKGTKLEAMLPVKLKEMKRWAISSSSVMRSGLTSGIT